LLAIAGTITTMVGVLLFAPLAIRALAAAGRRAPIAVRLAVRDLARYQARSAAALGAITLAVGLAATITITAAYHDALDGQSVPNLPSSQLVVYASSPQALVPVLPDAAVAAARSQVDAIAATLGTHDLLELHRAVDPLGPGIEGPRGKGKIPAALVHETPEGNGTRIDLVADMYVGTPAVLAHFGIQAADIRPDVDVVTSRTDVAGAQLGVGPRRSFPPAAQQVDLPRYRAAPNTLVTAGAVVRLGLQEVPFAWLLDAGHPLRSSEVAAARKAAATGGLSIETRDTSTSSAEIGRRVTVAGIVLALGVLALTIGLIRSETAHDLRTLAATGAGRRTRRTLTGVTAGALALLGALLGVAGGYLAIVAWYRSHLHPMTHVPFANLAIIVVGMPLLAATGGWLFSGRMPEAIARRPLD
jgi:putative ABC transport system permease protein